MKNKRTVGIVVDSTCGNLFKETIFKDASIVPLTMLVDEASYVDGTLSNSQLLEYMHKNHKVTTSQPAPDLFIEAYKEQLALGYESVICLVISGGLSGTINSATLAKTILGNDNVIVIDTQTVGPGVAFLLERLNQYLEDGLTAKEAAEKLMNKQAVNGQLLFSVDHLGTLVKGGRLTKLEALIGNILKIKPILKFERSKLTVEKKARGTEAVFKYLVGEVKKALTAGVKIVAKVVFVDDPVPAKELIHELAQIEDENLDIELYGAISPVVATHLGYRGMGIYINQVI